MADCNGSSMDSAVEVPRKIKLRFRRYAAGLGFRQLTITNDDSRVTSRESFLSFAALHVHPDQIGEIPSNLHHQLLNLDLQPSRRRRFSPFPPFQMKPEDDGGDDKGELQEYFVVSIPNTGKKFELYISWSREDTMGATMGQHSLPDPSGWDHFLANTRIVFVESANNAMVVNRILPNLGDPFLEDGSINYESSSEVLHLGFDSTTETEYLNMGDRIVMGRALDKGRYGSYVKRINNGRFKLRRHDLKAVVNVYWHSRGSLNLPLPSALQDDDVLQQVEAWSRFKTEGSELWMVVLEAWPTHQKE